ncbi:MAG: 6-carboxytetrahydropterin synthase QueD [Candidatus Omnitrophica bacterium]|nr:6-carboxytetrahydropterin synthase QueD [Candidatus Omnitrophota bacterium]
MYAIRVQAHFNAAHNLRGYHGKCERLHGHNWKVEVELTATGLNKIGMVCDFKKVKEKLQSVLKKLDHCHLNRIAFFKKNNPTSENIAEFIFVNIKKEIKDKRLRLKEVCVWETETSCAVFGEEDYA